MTTETRSRDIYFLKNSLQALWNTYGKVKATTGSLASTSMTPYQRELLSLILDMLDDMMTRYQQLLQDIALLPSTPPPLLIPVKETPLSSPVTNATMIKEIRRGWWNPDQIIEQLLDSIKCHKVMDVHIETIAFQRWLKFYIEKERKERGLYFRPLEIKRSSHVSKNERLDRIGPFLRAGKIYVRNDDPEYDALRREMREYPYGRYDDILDTLADAIQVLKPPGLRKQREENFRRPPVRLDGVNFQTGYSTWSAGR
jgi:predicted phage terminase large subunit-like protein